MGWTKTIWLNKGIKGYQRDLNLPFKTGMVIAVIKARAVGHEKYKFITWSIFYLKQILIKKGWKGSCDPCGNLCYEFWQIVIQNVSGELAMVWTLLPVSVQIEAIQVYCQGFLFGHCVASAYFYCGNLNKQWCLILGLIKWKFLDFDFAL